MRSFIVASLCTGTLAAMLGGAGCRRQPVREVASEEEEPPRWHFERIEHELGTATLTGIWARSDGVLVAVGASGTIVTNRPSGPAAEKRWVPMKSPTTENLTAIVGIENGARFDLPAPQGEMFAVGWHGTILHYNPNPDRDPTTDDGAWQVIAGPGGGALLGRLRIDPACPDFDGDGVSDDGDGDGWWGNAVCQGGTAASCDDNCRGAANGSLRPVLDLNEDACVGPGDGPSANSSDWQRDADGDGIGEACDDNDNQAGETRSFGATLFSVAAQRENTDLVIVAVGEDGSVVSYRGPDGAASMVNDPTAWVAEEGLAFRFSNDCGADTAPGQACLGSGRLPPACPAQCHPRRTSCSCATNQGQCCDAAASTGAACVDGSCGAAPNACDSGTGLCSTLCPQCFRRLTQTLRAVTFDGERILATGSAGMVVVGQIDAPEQPWTAPSCSPMPKPLDDAPLLASASSRDGSVLLAGSGGALTPYGGGCKFTPLAGVPSAFLSAVVATGGGRGYAVGDHGLMLSVRGDGFTALETAVEENLLGLAITRTSEGERIWVVGAGGLILQVWWGTTNART